LSPGESRTLRLVRDPICGTTADRVTVRALNSERVAKATLA